MHWTADGLKRMTLGFQMIQNGSPIKRVVEQQAIAVVDLRTLEVRDVASPTSLLSLQQFWHEGESCRASLRSVYGLTSFHEDL